MNPRVFREYDIRGVADRDLDDVTVRAIGVVLGTRVATSARPGPIVVGRDCRVTSPRLFAALTDGELRALLATSQPAWTAPETGYRR